jgi:hypothetical protein
MAVTADEFNKLYTQIYYRSACSFMPNDSKLSKCKGF